MNILSVDIDTIPKVRIIGHVKYDKPWIHFTRTIDEYILYIIKSGELYIKEGEAEYTLKSGDTLLLSPNVIHTGFKQSCCEYYYIHFRHPKIYMISDKTFDELSDKILKERKLSLTSDSFYEYTTASTSCYFPKHYQIKEKDPFLYFLRDTETEFYKRYENHKVLTSIKLLEMLIRISREYVSTEIEKNVSYFSKAFVESRKIVNYLNSQYHGKVTSKDIEELSEFNYDYINRVFHKITGNTIFNYLNTIRINKAKELIETTPINFSEIGYLVGIDDPYYFSKLFKKYTGMTPTQYYKSKNTNL